MSALFRTAGNGGEYKGRPEEVKRKDRAEHVLKKETE
jgi:hypothetical protein